ncbi:importin subunit alpha-5 [Chrysoperla carnea]|uniref:importin subunit alpha-5 n=1 Tax=Chrysoperla carnea TaxID=189513 RepID=UPI001D07A77C|nr:importin subunit alpha-5 [Chrysoperla carnea]
MSEARMNKFKNKGRDTETMRRRRTEENVQLRKARKDDQLQKRRNISEMEEPLSPLQEKNSAYSPITMTPEEIMEGLMSMDEKIQLQATQACRKILSRERNPPIDLMIQCGVVPKCVEFLSKTENSVLQFEACWALTNIASGTSEQTMAVVQAGALEKLVLLLGSPYLNVAEQAVWALGNIAGDGATNRDLVLNCNVMPALLKLIKPDTSISLLRNTVWAISNLCRNKNPPPEFIRVRECLPTLAQLLYSPDKDVLADTCWALSYLTDGSNEKIQAVIDTGLVPRLVQLLSSEEATVLTPSLRAVGNIVTGTDQQTDMVLAADVLVHLVKLLQHSRINIVKEAAWTVSNVTAGNSDQIQKVIDAGIMEPLLNVLSTGDFKSQKEAAWAVTNYTSGGTVHQIAYLVQLGVLRPLCALFNSKDTKTVTVALDGITNILMAAEKLGQAENVAIMIEACGGLDSLENLQNHENERVYEKALALIDRFFSEDGDENVPNNENSDGEISFNVENTGATNGFSF